MTIPLLSLQLSAYFKFHILTILFHSIREDFDFEYENDAELLLADMEFGPDDHPSERELKLQVRFIMSGSCARFCGWWWCTGGVEQCGVGRNCKRVLRKKEREGVGEGGELGCFILFYHLIHCPSSLNLFDDVIFHFSNCCIYHHFHCLFFYSTSTKCRHPNKVYLTCNLFHALNYQVIKIYNSKLDDREKRKRFVIDRGLVDKKDQIGVSLFSQRD